MEKEVVTYNELLLLFRSRQYQIHEYNLSIPVVEEGTLPALFNDIYHYMKRNGFQLMAVVPNFDLEQSTKKRLPVWVTRDFESQGDFSIKEWFLKKGMFCVQGPDGLVKRVTKLPDNADPALKELRRIQIEAVASDK